MGTTPRVPTLAFVLLYAGTGGACRESDHEPAVVDAISRIDSAGVVIVDHGTVSSAAARHGWRVDAAPVMTIGSGSAAAQALYRVKGGLFLGDSVVVVADGGSQQLRYFDRGGGVFAIAGGKGAGRASSQACRRSIGQGKTLSSPSIGSSESSPCMIIRVTFGAPG